MTHKVGHSSSAPKIRPFLGFCICNVISTSTIDDSLLIRCDVIDSKTLKSQNLMQWLVELPFILVFNHVCLEKSYQGFMGFYSLVPTMGLKHVIVYNSAIGGCLINLNPQVTISKKLNAHLTFLNCFTMILPNGCPPGITKKI